MKTDEDKNIVNAFSNKDLLQRIPSEKARDLVNVVFDTLNSTVSGVIVTDLDGMITFVNPSFCRMLEYLPTQLIGLNAVTFFAVEKVKNMSDVIDIIDLSENDTEEFVVERSDGKQIIVEVSASNVTSSSGQIVGRMGSFVDITKRKHVEIDRDKLIKKLEDSLEKIKTLRGLIPICAACKKIRDDRGFWHQVETYIKDHSAAEFTHSICPDCWQELYPEFQ